MKVGYVTVFMTMNRCQRRRHRLPDGGSHARMGVAAEDEHRIRTNVHSLSMPTQRSASNPPPTTAMRFTCGFPSHAGTRK